MKTMLRLFRTMLKMPFPWLLWIGMLGVVNMAVPLFYLDTTEGKVVLAVIMMGAIIQIVIFGAKGFVRLLGLGHSLWLFMVPWLWTRLDHVPEGSPFRFWLLSVVILNGISLLIDITDVGRYIAGERTPQLTLDA